MIVSKSNITAANPVALEIMEKKDGKHSYSYSGGEKSDAKKWMEENHKYSDTVP